MKRRNCWRLIFGAALCIIWLMNGATAVYGTAREAEGNPEETQKRLQEEQNAYNEAVAEQNRREVERAVAEKIAAQYAAMGLKPPAAVQWNMQGNMAEAVADERREAAPEELWKQTADSGDFSALYENAAEKQEKGKIGGNALSGFLEALTVASSPITDKVFPLTEITYDELKEVFPLNNAVFRERSPMRGFVRHDDNTGTFVFQYYWRRWHEEGTVLTVRYGDVNERGNFTSLIFDTTQEKTDYSWWSQWKNRYFVEQYGYEALADYNLGCEGFSYYLLKNRCLFVWDFMGLTGIEIDILDDMERPKEGILCRSFDTEYGPVTAFYYRNKDSFQEYFAIKFENHDTYDYILAQGITGGEMRIEVKMK